MKRILLTLTLCALCVPARAQTPTEITIEGRRYALTLTPLDSGVGPKPPTGLTATAGAASVDLAWTDASTDESSFAVWRNSGAAWVKLALLAADTTKFTDWSPPLGVTAYYRVQSVGETGSSPYSNEASAALAADVSAPRSLEEMVVITSIQPPIPLPTALVRNAKGLALWEVNGRNFGAKPGRFLINMLAAPYLSWSDTRIVIPEPPKECDITVWSASGSYATTMHRREVTP